MATATTKRGGATTPSAANPESAGLVRRGAALAIDYAVLLGLSAGVMLLSDRLGDATGLGTDASTTLGAAIVTVLGLLYFAAAEGSRRGATPGKLAMGIRVVDAEGGAITFGKGLLRTFSKLASLLPFGLGFLLASFSLDHRALHDHLAGTMVVRGR